MASSLPLVWQIAVFAAAAALVWIAGIYLATSTEDLSRRFGLGDALGGAILLALATNLPEIAITASAAAADNLEMAIGNILGGIAIQTVVLVAIDAFGTRGKAPLTSLARSPSMVIEATLVVAVLAMTIMATQLPSSLIAARVTPGVVGIALIWIAGLSLLRSTGHKGRSQGAGNAPAPEGLKPAHRRPLLVFAIAALATLGAGVALERSGDAVASSLGLDGALFGATILAAATALPELSTGLRSARDGKHALAVSDILGGNAFLPVLFLLATVISGQAVLPSALPSDIFLTALGMLLTCVYIAGLVLRPGRRFAGVGVDSLAVLCLYVGGMALLALHPDATG